MKKYIANPRGPITEGGQYYGTIVPGLGLVLPNNTIERIVSVVVLVMEPNDHSTDKVAVVVKTADGNGYCLSCDKASFDIPSEL